MKSNFFRLHKTVDQSVIKIKTTCSLSFLVICQKKILFLILQVKKRWEDMTTSVKRKERQARQEEIKRLKVTGNGSLPDEEV